MDDAQRSRLIAGLEAKTLEQLAGWTRPDLKIGIGPFHPDVFDDFEKGLNELRSTLNHILTRMPDEEIQRLSGISLKHKDNPLGNPNGIYYEFVREKTRLLKTLPAWFAGGWGVTKKAADFKKWGAVKKLRLDQAALLCVGVEPDETDYDSVFSDYGKDPRTDEVLYFLEDVFQAIERGLGLPSEDDAELSQADLHAWVAKSRYKIARGYRRMLDERMKERIEVPSSQNSIAHASHNSTPLHKSSLKLHARIILAMAMSKYGLESETDIAKVAKQIEHDVHLRGLTAETRSIVKLLRLGLAQEADETSW